MKGLYGHSSKRSGGNVTAQWSDHGTSFMIDMLHKQAVDMKQ